MKQKEIACFRVPPRKQAEETEAAFRQSTISKTNDTTNKTNSQIGAISQLLLCGAENALSRRYLMALTGYPDRVLRRQIETERRQGIAILSDNIHGYFLPETQDEIDHCVQSLRSRAAEIEATALAIERAGLP